MNFVVLVVLALTSLHLTAVAGRLGNFTALHCSAVAFVISFGVIVAEFRAANT